MLMVVAGGLSLLLAARKSREYYRLPRGHRATVTACHKDAKARFPLPIAKEGATVYLAALPQAVSMGTPAWYTTYCLIVYMGIWLYFDQL